MSDCICSGFRGLCIDENDGVVGVKSESFECYFVGHNYSSVSYLSQAGSVLMFISDLTSLPKGSLNAVNAPASPAISIVSIFIVLEFVGGFPLPGLLTESQLPLNLPSQHRILPWNYRCYLSCFQGKESFHVRHA